MDMNSIQNAFINAPSANASYVDGLAGKNGLGFAKQHGPGYFSTWPDL